MEALENKNEDLRACVINEKTYWYSKDRRRNQDIRKLCGEIYHQDPAVVTAATRRIWRSIKCNPAKLPAPLTLESLCLALDQHCHLDDPADRHAFFALLQHHEVFRHAFYHFVSVNPAGDVLLRGEVSQELFWEHVSKRFPNFSPVMTADVSLPNIKALYEQQEEGHEGDTITVELGFNVEEVPADKGKDEDRPLPVKPVETAAPSRKPSIVKIDDFKFPLPDFEEFPNQSQDRIEAHLKASQLQGAEVALGRPTYPLHFELIYKIWNTPEGFGQRFVEKFIRDPKFVEQLFVETPALIDMFGTDKLIEKAKTQPGIIMGAVKQQPVNERLLNNADENLVKQLLGQDWLVFGKRSQLEVKLSKPMKTPDGEQLTQPQDIIAGFDRLPDPSEVPKINAGFDVSHADEIKIHRDLIPQLGQLITRLGKAVELRREIGEKGLKSLRDQFILFRNKLHLKANEKVENAGMVEEPVQVENAGKVEKPVYVEDNSFAGRLNQEICKLDEWMEKGKATPEEIDTTVATLKGMRQVLNDKEDVLSLLYSAPICDFFVDAITYFSSGNTDAVDKILIRLSAGHLDNSLDQELRYRLYHPYTIRNMTDFWLTHFDKFVLAAGPHQEYLAHLLTHVKEPLRFLSALAKQDHLPRPLRSEGQAYQSRQQFIANHLPKIMPVLAKMSGKQAKKKRNQFLRKMRNDLEIPMSYRESLRRRVHDLIEQYALSGAVDKEDQLITLLDDDVIRGKLKLSPGEVMQLLTKGLQEGAQQHDPRFELIIARDANLWKQFQIAHPNFDLLPCEFPYLAARKALDAFQSGGLVAYVDNEYQKLQQHTHQGNVVAGYVDVRQLNSYQALLIVSSNKMWKQINPYQRYPVRAFLNRIGFFNDFFDRENKKLEALNPLFRWKLKHDVLVAQKQNVPKKFTDFVLRTPGTIDQPGPMGHLWRNASDIAHAKAEMGAIITDIARGADLLTAYKTADQFYEKSKEYEPNATLVDNVRVYNGLPEKVELGRLYQPVKVPTHEGVEFVGQNPLHVSLATTPKRREQFLKQIDTPEKMRATRELLFQTPVMAEVSTARIVDFLKSKEFGENLTNPLFYGRQILTRFPEKFCTIVQSQDPIIRAELPFVVKELSAVVQLILSDPNEAQMLTPQVLLAFLKIGGTLADDVLVRDYQIERRNFEASLIQVFIANPILATRLLDANFAAVAHNPDEQSADENLKWYQENLALTQARRCMNRITLANRGDLSAQHILQLMETDLATFNELFMRNKLAMSSEDVAVGRVLFGMDFDDFKRVIECVFSQDPASGFIWLQYRYDNGRKHEDIDSEILALLASPHIGIHYLNYQGEGGWNDSVRSKITQGYLQHYILNCRGDNSLIVSNSLKTFFQREPQQFYALLGSLTADEISVLAEFDEAVFQFGANLDGNQHPLLRYLVNPETVCDPNLFVKCLQSGFGTLKNIVLDVLLLKRGVVDRCQLLIEILRKPACNRAMLELLSPIEFNNVIQQALQEPEFVQRLEADPPLLMKLLTQGPENLRDYFAQGLTTTRLGTLLINIAGRAYVANERNDTVLLFVRMHQAALSSYLKNVSDRAEICATMTPEALVLLFEFAKHDVEKLFKSLCSSPHLMPRLVQLAEQGAIQFDLELHIKPLLEWISNNENHYLHCFNNPFLQDKFNQMIAQLYHSPVKADRVILRDLCTSADLNNKLKLVEQFGAGDLMQFLQSWDGAELPNNNNADYLMETGMTVEVFAQNWPLYQRDPEIFKKACRYRGDIAPWQQLLAHQWPAYLNNISQAAIVSKIMASQQLLDFASFLKDLVASGQSANLFEANPALQRAVMADQHLRSLVERAPVENRAERPQSPLRFFDAEREQGINSDNNYGHGQRGEQEEISLF